VEELQRQGVALDWLSTAAFWVYQRQDISFAILNHRPPKINLDQIDFDRSLSPSDDYTWTKRATCLHADVLGFCFETIHVETKHRSVASYSALIEALQGWDASKPKYFAPIHTEERYLAVGLMFPGIYFTLDHYGELSRRTMAGNDLTSMGKAITISYHFFPCF
jgi:hypothetical protein